MTTESMMSTTMMGSDIESTEAVTDTSLSTLELLQDFDFLGGDNGFIHSAFVTSEATNLQDSAVKDATETYESMHGKESASTTMGASVETTTDSVGTNSEASLEEVGTTESYDDVTTSEIKTSTMENSKVVFRDEEQVDSSTYFPVRGGEDVQDDDVYEDLTDLEVAALVSDVIFEETTTGSPEKLFPFEAVEADTEVIFDETTTPGPVEQDNIVPVNFGQIEAVEADYDEDVADSVQVFDETTTGGPLSTIDPFDSEEVNDFIPPKIEPVVAETTESEEEKIFDETTTGSPHAANLPLFQPVLAETEQTEFSETEQEFAETTTGSYEENQRIQDDDIDTSTSVEIETSTTIGDNIDTSTSVGITRSNAADSSTEETPAFTTAAFKNTTTVPLNDLEGDKVVFPEVKDDMLEVLKDMLLEDLDEATTTDTPMEETTVRVEISENILETTSRKILSASELNRGTDETLDVETTEMPKNIVQESEVVQVEAEGVNGPLNLNEAVYYDDVDDEYVDNEVGDSNFVTTEIGDNTMDTTTAPMTTVVNGFIVNKNPVLETLDNNGIETVRTGGDIKVEITTNSVEEQTTDMMMESTTRAESIEEITTLQPNNIASSNQDETTMVNNDTDDTTQEELESSTMSSGNDVTDSTIQEELDSSTIATESLKVEESVDQQKQNETEAETEEKRPASKYPITDLLNSIYRHRYYHHEHHHHDINHHRQQLQNHHHDHDPQTRHGDQRELGCRGKILLKECGASEQ